MAQFFLPQINLYFHKSIFFSHKLISFFTNYFLFLQITSFILIIFEKKLFKLFYV